MLWTFDNEKNIEKYQNNNLNKKTTVFSYM